MLRNYWQNAKKNLNLVLVNFSTKLIIYFRDHKFYKELMTPKVNIPQSESYMAFCFSLLW